ncbi:hypothetical protein NQ318_011680 [Aromia moschata]|uniref:Protein BCCIP homolog n=1 Tax=Aromia moschata TaxID=1265417 RepID=A0AAV8X3X1_9CUCU|nr:hypothetical protein NQ318_011680 [Aromia moschata]
MAGPTKKSRKPSKPESGEDSASEESESGTYHGQQDIQATFEGRNPEGHDFYGIKQLLNQLFLKAHIDISQMSDMLIAQGGIGSVLKQSCNDDDDDDDEDDTDMTEENNVFGITSIINLTSHKETPCVQQFYSLLDEISLKHTDQITQNKIKSIIGQSTKLGFLINERFVNISAKISPIMLQSLYEEVERMKKKDASYNFEYYVMISKTCRPVKNPETEEIFSNDEEELFSKAADITFDFSVAKESDTGLSGNWLTEDKQVVPYRRILIFKAEKFKDIIEQVSAMPWDIRRPAATQWARHIPGGVLNKLWFFSCYTVARFLAVGM